MKTINEWITEIHRNAVEHGWWDEERTIGEVCALISSEWSEALEEYRNGNPAHYYDKKPSCDECIFDGEDVPKCEMDKCPWNFKPEGTAVELADGIIRILDFFGQQGWEVPDMTLVQMMNETEDEIDVSGETFGDIVANLSYAAMNACRRYDKNTGEVAERDDGNKIMMWLLGAAVMAYAYIEQMGLDPEQVIEEKHRYNITRQYRHGGKRL